MWLLVTSVYAFEGTQDKAYSVIYKPTKTTVMKTLDRMGVEFEVDRDGDVVYEFKQNDWHGYIIFSYIGSARELWSLQIRTQFSTKASYYEELVDYANQWNANQRLPKVAMKTPSKMVLSMNYPVQFGFNPKEFEVNVFQVFNRMAKQVDSEIKEMRR